MTAGTEWLLAEKPTIDGLVALGYRYAPPAVHAGLRDGRNLVILRPVLVAALMRINGLAEADATAVYFDLLNKTDNEEWLSLLRGNYSRTVAGAATRRTVRLIDFLTPANNTFTVASQFRVESHQPRRPDLVVFVNGIPVVVIEAKSPLVASARNGEAFEQIKGYERDIPRLFQSNVFNVLTDGVSVLYGATGSPARFFAAWKDPWPRTDADFADALSKGLWCLLEPARLLDLIAHFVVFETDAASKVTVKKIARYQQFRAVNRMVARVVEGRHRKGLIWHTQGSGKSLTMVFAALKLKSHLTEASPELANPNLMVLTDRVDLDDQISRTFAACRLPNPERIETIRDLHAILRGGSVGLTLLSTIFKFQGSMRPVADSGAWIVMVDECHRTQEKDLGAFLQATLPDARYFGFTGTPVRKDDRDTYERFGAPGETYLDRYSIDDAVADGATVPIHYTGRKTDWAVDEARLDILFDTWFSDLPTETLADLKEKGVTLAAVVKHPKRVDLIAYDIWTHFKAYALPDGLKAQVVAFDREAVILYKRALDRIIALDLTAQGMAPDEALTRAAAMSACVVSSSPEDDRPSEDPHTESVRRDLTRHYLDRDAETAVKAAFNRRGEPPFFLIVCDKLLTGFDAPAEAVMYLDKPLKEHGLLQAIARTNRTLDADKRNGLIVDYIGVSGRLDEALASYREADVRNALRNLDELRSELRAAHARTMAMARGVKRRPGSRNEGLKAEYDALVTVLGGEDRWFEFHHLAGEFIAAYAALSPDPVVLEFREDLKWVHGFLLYGAQVFEKREALDHRQYSRKIREMLAEHVDATGLSSTIRLRHITDPEFADDFNTDGKNEADLKTAAIRKATELRHITSEKVKDNPLQYGKFSARVLEIIRRFEAGQMAAADVLGALEQVARDLQAEDTAHEGTGLSARAHGIARILEAFATGQADAPPTEWLDAAGAIDALYDSDQTAPRLWQEREQARKDLRQRVRRIARAAGFTDLKGVPEQVEEYALNHYAKA